MELGFADICPLNPVEIVMELVLQEVDLIVAWAYKIPGFRELDRDDQASLLSTGIKKTLVSNNQNIRLYKRKGREGRERIEEGKTSPVLSSIP